jgi:hypothetical protein
MVRSATVVLAVGADATTAKATGSGFFVAPDRVLSCAHVVAGAGPHWVQWNGQTQPAQVIACKPKVAGSGSGSGSVPAPDAAVLAATGFAVPHPVVPLADADPDLDDRLYLYGITRVRTGIPEPDGAVVGYAGRIGANAEFYKLAGGQIAAGQSGGPVLNLETRAVCGMTKQTLDPTTNIGGYAIPIADALAILPEEDLRAANLACHDGGLPALRRAQVGFGGLPGRVAKLIALKQAAPLLEDQLALFGVVRPAIVAEAELSEWIARHLYTLQLDQLVAVLQESAPALERTTLDVLQLVACCLPVGGLPTSYWVPSDAASALRLEWNRDQPRVVRLSTERAETAQLMLWRALFREVTPLARALPFSAEIGPDGLPPDLVDDVFASLSRYGVTKATWAGQRAKIVEVFRTTAKVIYLDGRALDDNALLGRLLETFGGLRFMITSRAQTTAADEMLLDLRPPIDAADEVLAIALLHDIEDKIGLRIVAA